MTNVIRTEKLVKTFRGVEALRGLDLDVEQGVVYALVGPNGAGKTTTIKVLMNIIPATSGTATVMGLPSDQLRGIAFQSIGYVSENQQQPERMTVGYFFDYLRSFYPSWDRQLEKQLVTQFALPLNRKLKHLSRGMRMKAALASALAFHPKLIVLDEPFTGLDPLVRDELIQGLLELAEDSSIFISSHDLAEIESFASHVGYLEEGRLRFSEELSSLMSRFREVEVTFSTAPVVPKNLPPQWMQVNTAAAVVRFVDSQFDADQTSATVRTLFGDVRNVSFSPMSLRQIFVVMARTGAGAAKGASA